MFFKTCGTFETIFSICLTFDIICYKLKKEIIFRRFFYMINTKEKQEYFSRQKIDIVGTSDDMNTYIYKLGDDGIMFREAVIDSGRGGDPVEILHSTDFHLNCLNARDCIEMRPCILSTREFRFAFRDGRTVPNTISTMALSKFFDQTVITGDTIDYITWGTFDLMDELIWKPYPETLVALGGHDITRVMQGKVADDTTLESRYDLVKENWRHDVHYVSKILGDKVRVVVLNNGQSRYFDHQVEKFEKELENARRDGHIILVFQHEQLCTHNKNEKNANPLRINDGSGNRNFCDNFMGCERSDEPTKRMYKLITENADIVKGVFCGHWHSDYYTEIIASYKDEHGNKVDTFIPQYVLTGNMYDKGHALIITVK